MSPQPNPPSSLTLEGQKKRKTIIVKRSMQTRFVVLVTFFVFIAIVSVGIDFYFHFGRSIQNFMDPSLYELFKSDTWVFLAKLALYMIAVTIFAVFASHKLAGPIYRFEQSARIVSAGDLTHRVHLRVGDEMTEFQNEFNTMVESLQRLVTQDAHMAMRVSKQIGEILHNHRNIPSDIEHKLQQVKSDVDHLHKAFKI